MKSAVKKHTLVLKSPIDRWDEAIPCGNGLLGLLVWGDSAKLKLSLDRADLWDTRMPEGLSGETFTWKTLRQWAEQKELEKIRATYNAPYSEVPYPTKLPAGRLEIDLSKDVEPAYFELDIHRALARVVFERGGMEAFVSACEPVGMLRMRGISAGVRICPFVFGGEYENRGGELASGGATARIGYPRCVCGTSGAVEWIYQPCAGEEGFAIVVGQRKTGEDESEIAFTVSCTKEAEDPAAFGRCQVEAALEKGFDAVFAGHAEWWEDFWGKSRISLPDEAIERHYYLVQYFYGAASRPGRPPMALQGVWTADEGTLPPWKGDYHNDLNTQMSYWAYQTANRREQGECFIDFLWGLLDKARNFARDFYGTSGACLPGVMTIKGQPLTGWPQYSLSPTNSAWLAQSFYLHWRYWMDEAFLREKAYPFCRDVARCLYELLERDSDGFLKLPLSSSPEIHDDELGAWVAPNSNFDLSLLQWLFGAVAEMADVLGETEDGKWCREVLSGLPALAVEAESFDGSSSPGSLMVSPEETLTASHRHFSHLMAIYPLGLLHTEGRENEQTIIDASLRHVDMLGCGLWVGFSFSWMACMAARCGKPERALTMFELFLKAFVSRNGFNLNGDYKKLGLSSWNYRPFTLEANFAAAQAVHEMLLQSWGGVVRVFPAVPRGWGQVSFSTLRAEGAFLVSADRRNGRTQWVRIAAEKEGVLNLRDPFDEKAGTWTRQPASQQGNVVCFEMKPGDVIEGFCRE